MCVKETMILIFNYSKAKTSPQSSPFCELLIILTTKEGPKLFFFSVHHLRWPMQSFNKMTIISHPPTLR